MSLEDRSPYFHDEVKGCKIEPFVKHSKTSLYAVINGNRCQTHGTDVCHCGWKFGHHYGRQEKKIGNPSFVKAEIEMGRHVHYSPVPKGNEHTLGAIIDSLRGLKL